jgi:hypothetical protein
VVVFAPPAPTVTVIVEPVFAVVVPVRYPPAPPPPPEIPPAPLPPPAITRYVKVAVFSATTPNVAFQAFVPVFISCTAWPVAIAGVDNALVLPFAFMVTPAADRTILFVPSFTMVITVPIGNATDAFVGIVIVCAPVLAE